MKKILIDLLIITASVYLAVYLVHSGALAALLAMLGDNVLLVSLIAGFFFTSFFTTPPAIVVFSSLSGQGNIFLIAAVGGLGAMLGDFVLFSFVRGPIQRDASALMTGPRFRRVMRVLRARRFRRILPVIGALIIASPFPDEIGLALIGVSSMKRIPFLFLSFSMNALGILVILLLAGAL